VTRVEGKEVGGEMRCCFLGGHRVANDATDQRGLVFVFYETGDAYGSESCAADWPRCPRVGGVIRQLKN